MAHPNRPAEVNVTPVPVRNSALNPPKIRKFTMRMAAMERTPVAIRPLYRAPMMDWFWPSLTKKVPAIEVAMQAAPIASGYRSMLSNTFTPFTLVCPAKKIAASTMVATMVTA